MTILKKYNQFDGVHWETGTVRNYLAAIGVTAPHSGEAYTEAMLLGISGGIVMGYFSFAYEGYEPQARILTRNTFDPLDTLLSRLGVVQNVMQTNKEEKGLKNLLETLGEGRPAIVWADFFSMPYNDLPYDEGMWGMLPLIVYGFDAKQDRVWIADRARVPLVVTTGELASGRGRVKNHKFRLLTLEAPEAEKLPSAIQKGIWDCITLFSEAPPKGTKNNFGFAAYKWLVELLTRPKAHLSWEREFPAGEKMLAGLISIFNDIRIFGKDSWAEREMYAQYLDEASVLLAKPALREAGDCFRESATAWERLALAALPDEIPVFKEVRDLLLVRHQSFMKKGNSALDEMRECRRRLDELKSEVGRAFPLDEARVKVHRERMAEAVMVIHDIELEAVRRMQAAMQ